MRHNTINGRQGTHHTVATLFWVVVAGIIAVIAFGDALALLAIVAAIVATAWWLFHELELGHGAVARDDTKAAPVTRLRPVVTGQRDLKKTSARASWRRPSAA